MGSFLKFVCVEIFVVSVLIMCYLVYCVIGVRFRDYFVRIGREIENKYELLKGNEWD